MSKKKKLDPNRFRKQDEQGLLTFDPIRRNLVKWGLIAGASGSVLMLSNHILWKIIGVALVVFIANYHVNQASQRIPRWHATILAMIGMLIGIFSVTILGSIFIYYSGSAP